MARIRTIKPEFWTDDKIISLPYVARLFFIGLWNFCDDHGAFEDKPEQLKLLVLPNEQRVDIFQIVDLLIAADLIERYVNEDDDKTFLLIRNWTSHQKVDHPSKSKILKQGAKKVAVPLWVRRKVAEKYQCKPGEDAKADCFFCGKPGRIYWQKRSDGSPGSWVCFTHELAHVTPEAEGGEAVPENLVLACMSCNRSMGTKHAFEWLLNGKYYTNQINPVIEKFRESSRAFAQERKGMEGNGLERKERANALVVADATPAVSKNDYEKVINEISGKEKTVVVAGLKNFLSKKPSFIQPYVDYWNVAVEGTNIPKVESISDSREKQLKIRVKEPPFDFVEIIRKVRLSQKLKTESSWFSFDWVFKNDKNYLKIIEGNYD